MSAEQSLSSAAHTQARRGGARAAPELISLLTVILDFLMITGLGVFAYACTDTWLIDRIGDFALLSAGLAGLTISVLTLAGSYRLSVLRSPVRGVVGALAPYVGLFSFFTVMTHLRLDVVYLNARWYWLVFLLVYAAICINRVAAFGVLAYGGRRGVIAKRIALLGASRQANLILSHLERDRFGYIQVVGVFDDRTPAEDRTVGVQRIDGKLQDLVQRAREGLIDEVIIALPWSAEARLRKVIDELRVLPVYVHLGADIAAAQLPGRFVNDGDDMLPMLTVANNPLSGWKRFLKAIEDRVLAAVALVLFAPIMAAVAIAIKLDSRGPIIYRQRRYGFNNKVFSVYKFRSMTCEPEPADGRTVQATKHDVRITRVGRFIRRTSLDELPQLINVLSGAMSLVGPRPHAVDHNEHYGAMIDGYFSRHKVKPGITGLAQINGLRGETDTLEKMEYRVRYDIYYVENWSILFDLEILALTVFYGFFGRNAY